MSTLTALVSIFGVLSLLAVGGGNTVLPEMQRQVVDVHHWMTSQHFAALYALAQAAPGPNMLVTTLIGWEVGGSAGALAATLAMTGPSCLLAASVGGLWHRFAAARWRAVAQAALLPVTVGLVTAGAAILVEATSRDWQTVLVTVAVTAAVLATRFNPLWLLAAAAVLGAAGLL